MPSHPLLGFAAGFASHFLADAIPHWDYTLAAVKIDPNDKMNTDMLINKHFPLDILKIGFDAALGVIFSLFLLKSVIHPHSFSYLLLGAAGGIVPDALQFIYWKFRHKPLAIVQRLHLWIHAKTSLNGKPVLGISLQALFVFIVVIIVKS